MIYGIGTDLVEVDRIKNSIEKYGDKFLKKVFCDYEIEYCEQYKVNKYMHYAARFAAKESFSKAIGTGFSRGFKFQEIGVKNEKSGKPVIILAGGLKESYGKYNILISLSHTKSSAIAMLTMEE